MPKKFVSTDYDYSGSDVSYITLKEISNKIGEWAAEHGEGATIRFYSCYDDVEIEITTKREETDAEYERRLALEEQTKNRQDFHDRREWERLKKKFGQ